MFGMKNWLSKSFIVFSLLIPKTPHQDLNPKACCEEQKKLTKLVHTSLSCEK
jgi:hypothetical protein